MQIYRRVLIAVDVYEDFTQIIERGLRVAGSSEACHILYVTYPQSSIEPYGIFLERDFSSDVVHQAMQALNRVAERYGIPGTHMHVSVGTPANEIHRVAKELDTDIIVIGTHGQKGMQLLLGSTANAVLHGVKSDVLAVKLSE